MLIGSIEAGGTKFVCAVGNQDYQIKNKIIISTSTPLTTLTTVIDYFKSFNLNALSVASFGPIEIRRNASKYGYITNTPKPGWQNFDFIGTLKKQLTSIPIAWTTDVNGSAYGEYVMSSLTNQNINSLVYYTVGTGVGAGAIINGHFLGSLGHPEMGHTLLKRHPDDLNFKGICPFHHDCLEGLVAGPTFEARLGQKGENVPLTNHVWDIMAYYLAQAVLQATLIIRPDHIVFGGSVISEPVLVKVRQQFAKLLNGYITLPPLEQYITLPQISDNGSATIGNFALGIKELNA